MKEIGKNSKLKINKTHATFVKVKIKNKTEKTGFFDSITKIEDIIQRPEKIKNKVEQNVISLILRFFNAIKASSCLTVCDT